MVEYFIDVAKECINIGNFNSLMAIIGKTLLYLYNILALKETQTWPYFAVFISLHA